LTGLTGLTIGPVVGFTTGLLVFTVAGAVTLGFVLGATLGALLGAALAVSLGAVVGVVVGAARGALADVVGAAVSTPPLDAGLGFGLPVATTSTIAPTAKSATTAIAPRIIGVFERGADGVEALPHDAPVADGLSTAGGCCAPEACAHAGPLAWIGDACIGIVGSIIGGAPGQLALCGGACGMFCGVIAGSGGICARSSTCVAGGRAGGGAAGAVGSALDRAAWKLWSADANSAQLWKRCSGSRAIAFRMIPANSGSMSGT
jgi:hypothetical protein